MRGRLSDVSLLVAVSDTSKAGDTLSSRHVTSCDVNACSWDVRGDLTLSYMAQIHTSVTLLTSRDLAWSSGRLTCQHASQIDMDMSYARMVRTASLTSYPVRCKM
jgi:hypothetical protein